MTWKPAITGAAAVIAAGIASGVLLGEGSAQSSRTITATSVVTQTAPPVRDTTLTPTESEGPADDRAPAGSTSSDTPTAFLAPDQVAADDPPPDGGMIDALEAGTTVQLVRGEPEPNSLGFRLNTLRDDEVPAGGWSMTITPPTGATRFATTMGFQHTAAPDNRVRVSFYRETITSDSRIASFRLGPSAVRPIDLDITGVAKLRVRFTADGQAAWRTTSDGEPPFGLLQPRFLGLQQ